MVFLESPMDLGVRVGGVSVSGKTANFTILSQDDPPNFDASTYYTIKSKQFLFVPPYSIGPGVDTTAVLKRKNLSHGNEITGLYKTGDVLKAVDTELGTFQIDPSNESKFKKNISTLLSRLGQLDEMEASVVENFFEEVKELSNWIVNNIFIYIPNSNQGNLYNAISKTFPKIYQVLRKYTN